jgi:hypothetical protein
LQADEAFWAGDKAAEGRLKGLVTSSTQMIENKGFDPIKLDNFLRIIFTSNEDWVIPAGVDERRFATLDVAPHCAQNHDYFREMDEQIANGGREALLADLLAFDLTAPGVPNLRTIPRTQALLEQKLRSLDSVASWWHERLCDGQTTRRCRGWKQEVPIDRLFDDFVARAEKIGIRRKVEKQTFCSKLKKLVPGLERVRKRVSVEDENGHFEQRRVFVFTLPPLIDCRAAFDELTGQPNDWGLPDDPVDDGESLD